MPANIYVHFSNIQKISAVSLYATENADNTSMGLQSASQCTPVKSSSSWPLAVLKHTEYFRFTRLWFT